VNIAILLSAIQVQIRARILACWRWLAESAKQVAFFEFDFNDLCPCCANRNVQIGPPRRM
jgi:hypothetical protein